MIRVAIIDDLIESIQELEIFLKKYEISNNEEFIIDTYNSGFEFLDNIKENYDIVFLDIDMPGINGMDVARKLRKIDKNVLIVFETNMASCAINGYEVEASDFLIKPIKNEQLKMCLDKCIFKIRKNNYLKLSIKTNEGYFVLKDIDIVYIEVRLHSLIFHTTNNSYETYGSLKDIERTLGKDRFARCNSCYLVNLDYVESISGDNCILPICELPISRSKKKNFIGSFLKNI